MSSAHQIPRAPYNINALKYPIMQIVKKIRTLAFFLCTTIFICISSCQESKKITARQNNKHSILSSEYYMQFNSPELRLAHLMCGTFSCYRKKTNSLFTVNKGKDSIIAFTVIVGDPNIDGTWVYKESVMSHFPEEPLFQLFQQIKQESPDSLTIYEYKPKHKENSYRGYQRKKNRPINIDDLVSTNCVVGVRKATQTSFLSSVDMCERKAAAKSQWTELTASYDPKGVNVQLRVYSGPDKTVASTITDSWIFFRRLKEQ